MSRPLRILWVASQLEGEWTGGIGRVVAGTLPALAERGHETHLAGRAAGPVASLAGVALHPWPPFRQKVRQLLALAPLIRRLDPDVVHFHAARPHGDVLVPLRLLRRRRRPLLVVTPYTGSRSHYRKRFARAGLRAADAVAPNSRWGAERAVAAGADPARVHVVPAGAPPPPAVSEAPREPLVLALCRLAPSKGVDLLLDAFAEAAAGRPAWRLCVAGDGPEAEALRARARALACAERVRLPGWLGGDAKARLLATAAVGVQPSRDDNFPGSLLELQAAGAACVASAVGGIPDILDDGRAGVLVPPGDAAALARTLAALMDDPARRAALSKAGRVAAGQRAWPRVAARLEALYRALVVA